MVGTSPKLNKKSQRCFLGIGIFKNVLDRSNGSQFENHLLKSKGPFHAGILWLMQFI